MSTTILAKPTIHLNGTSATVLLDGYINAMNAVREAIIKLNQIAPNMRDYYLQHSAPFAQAEAEHYRRVNALDGVLKELERLAEHAADHVR